MYYHRSFSVGEAYPYRPSFISDAKNINIFGIIKQTLHSIKTLAIIQKTIVKVLGETFLIRDR
jgi:hypothetical protein